VTPRRRSARGRLAGKAALVTGSTGGIGRAVVRLFADEGASQVLAGGRPAFDGLPRRAVYRAGDITHEPYVRGLVDTAAKRFGRLDILVNAHGIDYHSDLTATDLAEAERILRVNLLGAFLTMKWAIPLLARSGGGSVVNIASRLGLVAVPGQAVYSASKGGLIMLTRGAAIDHASANIRVNCVAPGMTATTMIESWVDSQPDPAGFRHELIASIPLGRLATPEEIAAAILFLASHEASYVTGVVLPVDGGYTAR
jgi:NAD(P)-dependent dehydrogenase (short-subunit alcohol dehydrogenase family)